jgi:TRAP-type C4-dicarboxylate transport system permease small subunit
MQQSLFSRLQAVLGAVLLSMIVLSILASIVARAVFNAPFTWTVELATILVIWSVYATLGLSYPERTQLSISVLADRLPPGGRRALDVLADSILVVVLVVMLASCWTAMRMNYGMTTMALDISVSLAYYLAAGVGALSMLGYIVMKYWGKRRRAA